MKADFDLMEEVMCYFKVVGVNPSTLQRWEYFKHSELGSRQVFSVLKAVHGTEEEALKKIIDMNKLFGDD